MKVLIRWQWSARSDGGATESRTLHEDGGRGRHRTLVLHYTLSLSLSLSLPPPSPPLSPLSLSLPLSLPSISLIWTEEALTYWIIKQKNRTNLYTDL